ncbi:hypothetical protein Ddye_011303 [Dipteronia dyeriana]|uniref:Uncharacterized protein n=1 Tax=Dipteronia dyeriana TaxID=168575 RepID=A0AAE0CGS3_9ROSI|nr:hypothetical protein Ddye_011303 [Dipteronia dyeriana]
MTVRETLSLSARCQGIESRYEMLAELARREKTENIKPDPDVDVFMKAASTKAEEANVVTDYIIKLLSPECFIINVVTEYIIKVYPEDKGSESPLVSCLLDQQECYLWMRYLLVWTAQQLSKL